MISFSEISVLLLLLWAGILVKWVIKRKRDLAVLQNLGYKCPPVNFIGGNLLELFTSSEGDLVTQTRWMDELADDFDSGKILGWYRGPRPVIYVTNPDFMKEYLIKESETFIDRPMLDRSDNIPHLIMLKGAHWKRVRSVLTPTFSAAKMKKMASIMSDAVDILLKIVGEHADSRQDANFYELYQGLTLDVIGQCGLAMKVNCQLDKTDELLVMIKRSMRKQIDTTAVIASFFPELEDFIAWLYKGGRKKTNDIIISWCQDILDKRRTMQNESDEKPIDSLQLMMDAAGGKNGEHRKLTDAEITANAFVFILAGYETTATSLSFTTYLLAAYPEIQEKVYEEIKSFLGDEDNLKNTSIEDMAEAVNKMPYLDQVFKEALRMYPPIPLHFGRRADAKKVIMGKTIPEGCAVMIPTWYIHHDPKLWPEPWKFDPDRFSPENKHKIQEMSYIPFGEGPRKCIGWRFANLEAKLTLVMLLRNFKITLSSNPGCPTSHPIKFRNKGISLAPANDEILLRPMRRN